MCDSLKNTILFVAVALEARVGLRTHSRKQCDRCGAVRQCGSRQQRIEGRLVFQRAFCAALVWTQIRRLTLSGESNRWLFWTDATCQLATLGIASAQRKAAEAANQGKHTCAFHELIIGVIARQPKHRLG